MTPKDLMARAIALSGREMRTRGVRPFAALIVRNGEIVGEGCNDTVISHDPTAHGEVLAIRDATRRLGTSDLSGCEIYTTCEPCSLCVAAIWWARLDKMYYAATLEDCAAIGIGTDGLIEEVSRPIAERKLPTERMMGAEAREILQEWSKTPGFKEF